ncbi:hypothetical protein ACHAWF_018148 [Thalassiosira exigua]
MTSMALTLSLSRRRFFQIGSHYYPPRDPVVRSCINYDSIAVAAPPPSRVPAVGGGCARGLSVRSLGLGECNAETKTPWSRPPSLSCLGGRWSSTFAESKRGSERMRGKPPLYMKNYNSIQEASAAAFEHLDDLNSTRLTSFWTRISQILTDPRRQRKHWMREDLSPAQYHQLTNELALIFKKTLTDMSEYNQRHLTQLALGFAKIVREVDSPRQRRTQEPPEKILHGILVGQKSQRKDMLFRSIAVCASPLLPKFEARYLANLAYANAIVGTVPRMEDGKTLFDHVAKRSIPLLKKFEPQHFSNMVWAHEKVAAHSPGLFDEIAKEIVALNHLGAFAPQALANILYAYAKSGVRSRNLFGKVANHIVCLEDLGDFAPQCISNTVWSFAKAGESNSRLFEKVAHHIVEMGNLDSFGPQNLANTLWAYSKAKEPNPGLYQKIGDHIVGLNRLNSFNPQNLVNTVWAFAKAGESHPQLFQRVADHVLSLDDLRWFGSKHASQILWSYASAGINHTVLFKKVHDHVDVNIDYKSLDKDSQRALLRAYQKADQFSKKKEH